MPRPSQPILSRDLIFRTALAKLDRTGGFTIPEIAHKLGVSVSSLYHHVKGRADILEGIRGLMADWDATTTDLPWQEAVAAWARNYRDSFAKHPAAIPALVAQTITEQSVLNQYESLAAILSDAGFSSRSVVLSVNDRRPVPWIRAGPRCAVDHLAAIRRTPLGASERRRQCDAGRRPSRTGLPTPPLADHRRPNRPAQQ